MRELVRGECGMADDGSDGPLRVRDILLGRDEVAVDGDGLGVAFVFGFPGAAMVGVLGSVDSEGWTDFGGEGAGAARGMVVVMVSVNPVPGVAGACVVFCFFLACFSDDATISAAAANGSALGVSSSLLRFLAGVFASSLGFSFLSFLEDFSYPWWAVETRWGEMGGFENI